MINMKLFSVAAAINGTLRGNGADKISGVALDTRQLQQGALYFAFKGQHVDGHDLLTQAQQAGAVAAVVTHFVEHPLAQIQVANSKEALGQLARHWRSRLSAKVVAITGSNGKTTVKEMLAAILKEHGKTAATSGNLNNDLGLPLSVLNIDRDCQYAVLEMGANHFGEIDYMCAIAKPDVAVVNNVGSAHLEGFGSLAGVANAKSEIYDSLGETGIAIINADDAKANLFRSACAGKRTISFGMQNPADVRGAFKDQQLQITVGLDKPKTAAPFLLQLLGEHNAMNALAATAAARALKIPLKSIVKTLATMTPYQGRLQQIAINDWLLLIDDTYNANPVSVLAGLSAAASLGAPTWLVLGELGELGDESLAIHAALGEKIQQQGASCLFALAGNTKATANAFGEGGHFYQNYADLIADLRAKLRAYAAYNTPLTLLVKGSRSAKMERVVADLKGGLGA